MGLKCDHCDDQAICVWVSPYTYVPIGIGCIDCYPPVYNYRLHLMDPAVSSYIERRVLLAARRLSKWK
jgi:hypothetical protein